MGQFVCYNCLVKRKVGKRETEFGAWLAGKKICVFCLPYVDEASIGALIAFDMGLVKATILCRRG